jgi:hypothetical protein
MAVSFARPECGGVMPGDAAQGLCPPADLDANIGPEDGPIPAAGGYSVVSVFDSLDYARESRRWTVRSRVRASRCRSSS